MWTLGLDIGTTGCKAVVFDDKWNIRTYSYREYDLIPVGDNQFDLSPEIVWNKVQEVIIEANSNLSVNKIEAMAISAIGDVIIPLGEKGCIVRPSILDFDPRGAAEISKFSSDFGTERIFIITGMPPLFINSLAKILWLKKYEPENYAKIKRWATYEDYILTNLGLNPVVSYSLAARTMLFDIRKKIWAEEVLESAGVKREALPEPIPSGEIISKLDKKVANKLGFKNQVIVCSGGHDMVCAAIGTGLNPKELTTAVNIIGTIEGIVTVLNDVNTSKSMLQNYYPCYPGYKSYVSFSVNLTSGCILKWLRDELSRDIIKEAKETGKDVYDIILENLNPDSLNNIIFIPYFAGSGNPNFDLNSQGCIYGLTLDTTRDDIIQGLIEGLCFEIRSHLEGFNEAGISINSLRAVGGGAKSDKWLQLKANITGKEVVATGIYESSALGAAALSATAVGVIDDPYEASKSMNHLEKVFKPQVERQDNFDKKFNKYQYFNKKISEFELSAGK